MVRADAFPRMGGGHAMRCLALAQAWNEMNGRTIFAMAGVPTSLEARLEECGVALARLNKSPGSEASETADLARREGARWIVADGYHFAPDYHAALRASHAHLLCLDDEGRLDRYEADIVVNQNVFANHQLYERRADSSRLLLGPRYALLRRQFSVLPQPVRETPARARKLLVTLGAADLENVTLTVVQALQELDADGFEAVVVVGGANPHQPALEDALAPSAARIRLVRDARNMPELMAWADLAISAAGSTTLELAFMGVPMLLLVLADNQAPVARCMAALGAARDLGRASALNPAGIAEAIRGLLAAPEERAAQSAAGRRLVDGRGAQRVAGILKRPLLKLRPAGSGDETLLFELANDPAVRVASFRSAPIPWEDHRRWFRGKLDDPNAVIFVAESAKSEPAGVIRFDIAQDIATISIAVAAAFRGQGHGAQLIEETSRRVLGNARVRAIRARVKPGNDASSKAFLAAGFCEDTEGDGLEARTFSLSSQP